jgi:hypothetical protein
MYLLDANIFIQSKNLHYGFDFVPAFWDWLDRGHTAGVLCSIEKVGDELRAINDDLTSWAASRKPLFLAVDAATTPSLAALAGWAASGSYRQSAINAFLSGADYQIVAYAHAHGHTVVTHERSAPQSLTNIKMPEACIAMGVPCIDPFTMLRNEGARFVL